MNDGLLRKVLPPNPHCCHEENCPVLLEAVNRASQEIIAEMRRRVNPMFDNYLPRGDWERFLERLEE